MIARTFIIFASFLSLCACSQEPAKTDWLKNSPKISQDTDAASQDALNEVGTNHTSHSGHR